MNPNAPYAAHNACAALVEMYAGLLTECGRREQAALQELARTKKDLEAAREAISKLATTSTR